MSSDKAENKKMEVATLGGGCFWCLEPIFVDLPGVESVVVGYAGGESQNPIYAEICTGASGHAEVVHITFDAAERSFGTLLHHFFTIHDPTTLNRQGNDRGSQYRSVIFYHGGAQLKTSEEVIEELVHKGIWSEPIVTEIAPAPEFYRAEEYHQHYFELNPQQPYCQAVVAPKVAKFRASIKGSAE